MDAYQKFRRSIYEEHRDEAGSLYEQRVVYLDDITVSLSFLAEIDGRFEAHLDGLFLGGAEARAVCTEAAQDEPGHFHTALRLLVRQADLKAVLGLIAEAKLDDAAFVTAASDGLAWELTQSWTPALAQLIAESPSRAARIVGKAIGTKRLPLAGILADLAQAHPENAAQLLWSIGQIGDQSVAGRLTEHLDSKDPGTVESAARAALRLGQLQFGSRFASLLSGIPAIAVPLALCAGVRGFSLLANAATSQRDAGTVMALGMLGDPSAIPLLLDLLGDPSLASSAATALALLTGAGLAEQIEVPVPTEAKPASEADDSAIAVEDDADLAAPITAIRVSQDRAVWSAWVNEHARKWPQGARIQMGAPAGPETTLRALEDKSLPSAVRSVLVDELLIRYGIDIPFAPDLPAGRQLSELRKAGARVPANHFQPGRWYLGGELA